MSPLAPNHISRTHPELVRSYGKLPLARSRRTGSARRMRLRVVMDVVKRYDVDGIHFDDYFYPYHGKKFRRAGNGFSRRRELEKIRR